MTQNTLAKLLSFFLIVLLSANVLGQGKGNGGGKPGGGGDPPAQAVLPNVRYELVPLNGGLGWESVFPVEVNGSGQLVGWAYDPNYDPEVQFPAPRTAIAHSDATGTINLNYLANVKWLDLNIETEAQADVTANGWHAQGAHDINEAGEIIGSAMHPNAARRAFILQDAFGLNPRFLLLPTVSDGVVDELGSFINNHGEAVGSGDGLGIIRYQPIIDSDNVLIWPYYAAALQSVSSGGSTGINDDGVIIGVWDGFPVSTSFVQFASGQTSYFENHTFWALSNGIDGFVAPMISGQRQKTKGKNGQPAAVIRLPVPEPSDVVLQDVEPLADGLYSRDINDYGDTVFDYGRGFLYYDLDLNPDTINPYGVANDGILPLDDLVVTADPDWHATNEQGRDYYYRFDGLSNREPETGFGYIAGFIAGIDKGFILIPYIPQN